MSTLTVTLEIPATIAKQIGGHDFTLDMSKVAPASLTWLLVYGTRGLNDKANSAKKLVVDGGGSWLLADSRAFVDALYDGSIAERAARSGTSTVDPIGTEARKLALNDILAKIGAKNWAEAAKHEIGKKFVQVREAKTGNTYMATDDKALDEFIAKNPARDYLGRAKVIVESRNVAAADDGLTF